MPADARAATGRHVAGLACLRKRRCPLRVALRSNARTARPDSAWLRQAGLLARDVGTVTGGLRYGEVEGESKEVKDRGVPGDGHGGGVGAY
jgi:hypothetical protein